MSTWGRERRVSQLETCSREMFGDLVLTCQTPPAPPPVERFTGSTIRSIPITFTMTMRGRSARSSSDGDDRQILERRRASDLVDQLLMDIYNGGHSHSIHNGSDCNSTTSTRSHKSWVVGDRTSLHGKHVAELSSLVSYLETHVERTGSVLVRRLKRRDALRRQQDAHCDVITGQLLKRAPEGASDPTSLRFTIQPTPGESGFSQWAAAMKMVAQLSGGIPPEFRRRLWLTLSDKHLAARGVDWPSVERSCFSEWSHPTDSELGVQIVKDLHRTGCSLFCGEDGQENQALLKRVLLAYARWNKAVGYCQGFNMLAALILQVTDKCETDALKLMIYLIEGVLPDSYFADSLRGLSVDMAVFRELLRTKLPRLSRHLDTLQNAAKDGTTSYEPPLTNVFTMQWFLTLFCNCLPQPTVLRVWDLILLEGNEILLRTALAIWQTLEDRILGVRSADEFYCIMGVLTRELLEFGLLDANSLVKAVVTIGPLTELHNLREHYLYNINPWGAPLTPTLYSTTADKQLKPYPKERLVLDISALKQQYSKLKQRQRQAHIIFSAAISRQPPPSTPVAMNHLLLGKSALVPAKRLGPPKGSIPPLRPPPSTLLWKDTPKAGSTSSSSSDTELCDDPSDSSSSSDEGQNSKLDTTVRTKTTPQVEKASANGANLVVDDNILEQSDVVSGATATQPNGSPPQTPMSQTTVDSFLPDDNKSSSHIDDDNIFDNNTLPLPPPSSTSSIQIDFDAIKFEESDDDSVDFERFLEDRVRCLKEIDDTIDEERSESRAQLARRNSQRALQIIQENSLILHRIMQCQSRLSPSPPIADTHNDSSEFPTYYNADVTIALDEGIDKDEDVTGTESGAPPTSLLFTSQGGIGAGCSAEQNLSPEPPPDRINDSVFFNAITNEVVNDDALISSICDKNDDSPETPEYGSRYTSILEKSRNLNEKYNSLILNANIKPLKPVSDTDSGIIPNEDTSPSSNLNSDFKSVGATSNFGISVSPITCSGESNLDQSKFQDFGGNLFSNSRCDLGPASHPSNFYSFTSDKETKDEVKNSFSLDLAKDDINFLSTSPSSSKTPTNRLSPLPSSSPHLTVNFGEYFTGEGSSLKSNLTSPSIEEQSTRDEESQWKPAKSPTLRSPTARSPTSRSPSESLKSPNKVFNPFPISLSSRQSKEVPLKLGLYKK